MLISLINKIFVNQKDDIILLLKKYELDTFLSNILIGINKLQISELENGNSAIGSMSSTLLTRLNTVLEKIECLDEKENLEYILSEISNELICQVIQKEGLSQYDFLTEIKKSLITTCELNNWDADLLLRKTKIDILHTLSVKTLSPSVNMKYKMKPNIYYYEWLQDDESLKELAYNLKDKKIIKSAIGFMKLFDFHNGNIRIKVNPKAINFIIILFDQMKINNLIKPRGTNGHFLPLKNYFVDFENNILFKNDPKRIKELLKRKDEEYKGLLEQVEDLIVLR